MNVTQIYKKYKIPPNLQKHQLRVAAVGELIALNSTKAIDVNSIVLTCLLHDMGNIIKFSFEFNPKSFEPEGVEYWKNIQYEFIQRYGKDEHKATYKIAEEIGVSKIVLDLLDNVGFSISKKIYKSHDMNKYICSYADHRVSPNGVLSLTERVKEGLERFILNKPHLNTPENVAKRKSNIEIIKLIEKEIFLNSRIKPEGITDEKIEPLMSDLIMQNNFVL